MTEFILTFIFQLISSESNAYLGTCIRIYIASHINLGSYYFYLLLYLLCNDSVFPMSVSAVCLLRHLGIILGNAQGNIWSAGDKIQVKVMQD